MRKLYYWILEELSLAFSESFEPGHFKLIERDGLTYVVPRIKS